MAIIRFVAAPHERAHVVAEAQRRKLTLSNYLRESLGLAPQQRGQRNDLAAPPAPKRSRKAVAR